MNCAECGGKLKKGKGDYRYSQSGLDNIVLGEVPNYTCRSCGAQEWEIPRTDGLHFMIAFLLALKPVALEGKEARFLRKHLGYTAEELAKALGVKRGTVTRWENETTKITPSNDKHLRRFYLQRKNEEIISHPEIMRVIASIIDFISLDGTSNDEVKIRSEDWASCSA